MICYCTIKVLNKEKFYYGYVQHSFIHFVSGQSKVCFIVLKYALFPFPELSLEG